MLPVRSSQERREGPGVRPAVVRVALVIFMLGLAPIATLCIVAFQMASSSTRELILSNNQAAAMLTRSLVRTEFEHRIHTLSGFASNPAFREAVAAGDEQAVRLQLGELVDSQPRIERAFVTDREGLLWSDYPRAPESLGLNFSHRDWYAGVSAAWSPYVSSVYRRNAHPRVLLVAVAAPVRSATGSVIGIAVYQIRLERLTRLVSNLEIGAGGYAILLDHYGQVAAHPHLDLQAEEHQEYARSTPVREAPGSDSATRRYVDPVSNVEMLSTSSQVDVGGNAWTVITQQPLHEAFGAVRMLGWQIAGVGLLVATGLAVGLTLLVSYETRLRQTNARLDELNRELSEENLERRRMYGTLLANLPGMVYRCRNDEKWTMEFVSDDCKALTGYEKEALLQNRDVSYRDLIHPEDRELVREAVERGIQKGQSYTVSYRLQSREGKERWVWERSRAVLGENGKVVALEGFISDITEQKSLEQQLLQSQKMEAIGQLAGGIAHDFNNLLTVITGYTAMVLDEIPESSPWKEEIREVNRAGERAASLTRQLLAFSRKQVLKPEVIDLNGIVAGMDRMLRRLIGENIDLETRLSPDLHRVRFDPSQIEQIIMNLAVNARDAMPEGGLLTLETANVRLDEAYVESHPQAQVGDHAMIAITDTGTGMDAATRERIFDPFFTTKGVGRGTGLGLSTVFGIVKQSGGNIWVYSEPGRGTTFKVYLPKAIGEEPETREEEPSTLSGRGETLLVVEDEASVRGLIRTMLEKNGYRVLATGDPEEAVEMLKKQNGEIRLLLTDMVLSDMDGQELSARAAQVREDLKVVYMSGYTDSSIVRRGTLGANVPFIDKPIVPTKLLRTIRMTLDS